MHCSFDVGCHVTEYWQWVLSEAGRQALWQFLKDIAAILGVALTFLKWWESREAYIFGRLSDVLGEQSTRTREAVRYVIQHIRRPGPADRPRTPVFAELALRRLFSRHHWKPVFSLVGPYTSADRKLRRIHRKLDKRQHAATNYQTFVNEQRFAAHLLQGVIALGRSEGTTDHSLNRLNEAATNSLQRALTVPGKQNDLEALELKGILLRKLGAIGFESDAGAPRVFEELRTAAEVQLGALDGSMPDKRLELTFVVARAVRYLAEMYHGETAATDTGRTLLDQIAPSLDTKERPAPQQLLDRARFFEVYSCIRMARYGAADGEKTSQRISAAVRDYKSLRVDCDPKSWDWPTRIWRACARVLREDGAPELLREAKAGIARIERIERGLGCPICRPNVAYQGDPDRTVKPAQ